MNKNSVQQALLAAGLFILAFAGRIALADWHNVETVMVATMLAGILLHSRYAMFVPLFAMIASDLVMGNPIFSAGRMSQIVLFTYSGFAMICLSSILFSKGIARRFLRINGKSVAFAAGLGAGFTLLYDAWTNLGWWYLMYPHTLANLGAVYLAGVPFALYHLFSGIVTFVAIGLPVANLLANRAQCTGRPQAAAGFLGAARQKALPMALAACCIVLSFTGCGCIGRLSAGETQEPVCASMVINGYGWTVEYSNITTINATAYLFLLECASVRGFEVNATYHAQFDSFFVESINGSVSGDDGRYWMFYVNGVTATAGCDKTVLCDGDTVEWRYEIPCY
ncbi:MAG: hypothetical protein CVT48_05265 [Thermoplasmata archaeon HGW-Thermoplasmata-1]|nr:MAG: hypothetical protein CVT48_05265 [Thermoplasmata archaeon HGW-Thermoplasmata-1]